MDDSADVMLGASLKRLIAQGTDAMKDWLKAGDEINKFTTSNDYSPFLYQFDDGDKSYRARVNKASEFVQIVLPYVYPQRPDSSVIPAEWADTWARKRMGIEERYADYAARVGDLDAHMKRSVSHALIFGRGMLWGGYDDKAKVAKHVFGEARDCIQDPDARLPEERDWQARRRYKPRWRLAQLYPQSKAIIEGLPAYNDVSRPKHKENDRENDIVEYFEFYTGVSVRNFMPAAELAQADNISMDAKEFYCIADGKILHKGSWPIPYFLINEWPGACLDLIETPGCTLPKQPIEPGLGHLRWMNIMYTQFAARWADYTKSIYARLNIGGMEVKTHDVVKVIQGTNSNMQVLEITAPTLMEAEHATLDKLWQKMDMGDPVPGFERAWTLASEAFKEAVGLHDVLRDGQARTQIRTSAAADLIATNSKSRIEDFRETTVKYLESIFRRNLFAARYLERGEDLTPILGEEAAVLWGQLGPPDAVQQERQARAALTQEALAAGVPPDEVESMIGPPQFIDMMEWVREGERSIDAGSMRRLDQDAQQQAVSVAMNQFAPSVISLPGGAEIVGALAVEFGKLNRMPTLQAAAENMVKLARQQSAMQAAMAMAPPAGAPGAAPPAPGEPPTKPPNAGPEGGRPIV